MNSKITYERTDESDFHYKVLKTLVNERLKTLPKSREQKAKIRSILLLVTYFALYFLAIANTHSVPLFYSLYIAMGLVMVLVYLNLIHETVHGNVFENKFINQLVLFLFDLMGPNSYIWKKRHIIMHHNYPNIFGWDTDIEQAGIFKIYPHGKPHGLQHYQHYLFVLLYPLYLSNWLFIRDFKDFFLKNRLIKKTSKIPKVEYVKLIAGKLLFLTYMVGIPVMLGLPLLHAILALLILLVTSGIFSLLILLSPHANIKNRFPLPDEHQVVRGGWFFHQLNTTNDVTTSNWFTRNLMGNFNYHLAHHLFPYVSCVYAPEITEIIKKHAQEYGLSYRSFSLFDALKYHYLLLKQNADVKELFEETM